MIDSYAFLHFAVMKNEKPFFFLAQMGVTYDDTLAALEDIKAGIIEQQKVLKENYEKQQQEKQVSEDKSEEAVVS